MFIKIDDCIFNKNSIHAVVPFSTTELVVQYEGAHDRHIKFHSRQERDMVLEEIWMALNKKGA